MNARARGVIGNAKGGKLEAREADPTTPDSLADAMISASTGDVLPRICCK
jgi:hypothetical protein